jgi:hypothetical protein
VDAFQVHLSLCLAAVVVRRVLVDLVVHVFLVGLAVLFHDQVDLVDLVYLVALAVLYRVLVALGHLVLYPVVLVVHVLEVHVL